MLWILAGCVALRPSRPLEIPPGEGRPPAEAASLHLTQQGKERIEQREMGGAREVLERAITVWPNNPYAYYYLALSRRAEANPERLLSLLARSERLLQEDRSWLGAIYLLRGEILEGAGRVEEARAAYRRALDEDPGLQAAREAISRTATE